MNIIKACTGVLFILFMLGSSQISQAQNEADALRYSRSFYPANARSAGVANAFGALGANSIAPTINPAGLGLYRQSEITFTPAFSITNTETDFLGESQSETKPNLNIGNLGLVFNKIEKRMGEPKTEGWVGYTFALGFNRSQGLHQRSIASGINSQTSILQAFADRAQGTFPSEFTQQTIAGLAYKNWLINPYFPDSSNYYTSTEPGEPTVRQEQTLSSSGSINDIYLSFGANYSNKLYLGGTVGIPVINYEQKTVFRETNQELAQANLNDSLPNFRSMSFTEQFSTSGTGIYAGFGLIYRPVDFLRIGGSIYSPTFYSLQDNYQYTMSARVEDTPRPYDGELQSPEGEFKYSLSTPFRALGNLAFIISNKGFISVDYEFKDYSNAQLSSDDYSFLSENNTIETIYKPSHSIRLGAEYRYDIFSIRGGFGYYSSPFKEQYVPENTDGSSTLISFGLGMNEGPYSFDIAYQAQTLKEFSTPYQTATVTGPAIKRDITQSNILFTLGYRW